MNKKLVMYILGSVLLLTVMGVYLMMGSLDQPTQEVESGEDTADSGTAVEADGDVSESSADVSMPNPFEENVKTPLNETYIQQYIHAMSHQKVQAKEKWSFYEITEGRINFLLKQLEVNKYENESLYWQILTSWKEGDFSNAVSHHNSIWRLQDGTIGKATSLLGPEAEESFLQEQKKESR
jgi:hypothetical protein